MEELRKGIEGNREALDRAFKDVQQHGAAGLGSVSVDFACPECQDVSPAFGLCPKCDAYRILRVRVAQAQPEKKE